MTKETVRSKSKKVPEWQSKKMKTLISDGWPKIRQVVQAREKYRQQFNRDVAKSEYDNDTIRFF